MKRVLFCGNFQEETGYIDTLTTMGEARAVKGADYKLRCKPLFEDMYTLLPVTDAVVKCVADEELCDDSLKVIRVAVAMNIPIVTFNEFMGLNKPTQLSFIDRLNIFLAPFLTNPQKHYTGAR
jgi:hypothetical protein